MAFWNDLKVAAATGAGLMWDCASLSWEHVIGYMAMLKRMFLWLVTAAVVFLVICILVWLSCRAYGWNANWIFSIYFLLLGFGAVTLYVLAFPVLFASEAVLRLFPSFRRSIVIHVERMADIFFSLILVAIYFLVAPVSLDSSVLPLLGLTLIALVTGFCARRFCFDSNHSLFKVLRTAQVGFLIVTVLMSIHFPQTVRAITNSRRVFDDKFADSMKTQAVQVTDPDHIPFVSEVDGQPRLWYFVSPTGEYELYDRPGYHRTGVELKPTTTDTERQRITQYFRSLKKRIYEEGRATEEERRQATARQANEHAQQERERKEQAERLHQAEETRKRQVFLKKYLNDQTIVNSPDSTEITVVVVNKNKESDPALSGKLLAALADVGMKGSAGLISGAFLADGYFDRLWAGSPQDVASLELARRVDWLLLCKVDSEFENNPELGDSLSAHMTLSVHIVRTENGVIHSAFSLSQAGVGFTKAAALEAANDRMAVALKDRSEIKSLLGGH